MALIFVARPIVRFAQAHPRIRALMLDLLGLMLLPVLAAAAIFPLTPYGSGASAQDWQLLFSVLYLGVKPLMWVAAGLLPLLLCYKLVYRRA
ncbi:hypothetical protein [Aliiroseovarius sp. YM-037]|uniref:hypothetical protein n=1 Tax=Aliiroseovarius sp. YM-037 TaxID=3341728 RepID=UPI003A80D49F